MVGEGTCTWNVVVLTESARGLLLFQLNDTR